MVVAEVEEFKEQILITSKAYLLGCVYVVTIVFKTQHSFLELLVPIQT